MITLEIRGWWRRLYLRLRHRQFRYHATVEPDGSFTFHSIPNGDYQIWYIGEKLDIR